MKRLEDIPETVKIVFPDSQGNRRGTCVLPWARGKRLQHYFHEPVLKAESLISRSKRCYIYREDGTKVRLQYEPNPSETITLVLAPRAAS